MFTIHEANQTIFQHVEGWVGDRIWIICNFLKEYHELHNVSGGVAEIGVHHGKLFFLISHIPNDDGDLIALDIFDDQDKNVDKSGEGSRDVFERHLEAHFPHLKDRVKIHSTDSMAITSADIPNIFKEKVSVFSVDGGHTIAHVVNDLSIAQEVISPRGTVLLDDFFGPVWPTVTEGFFRYMDGYNRRLAPYLIFQNKLFLTTFSEHESALEELKIYLEKTIGDEIHSERWRHSMLCGFKVLCFG